ncbi:MAG: hypothetical protein AB7S36_22185 [Planctomycetota bacterium]
MRGFLIAALATVTLTATAYAQPATTDATPPAAAPAAPATFAAPVPVTNGDDNFSKLLYPTPVLQDVDGDGVRELVVGDLRGYLYVCDTPPATATADGKPADVAWTAMANMQCNGKPIKLNNW